MLMNPVTYQIVAINHDKTCLYGELVQSMESRKTCWLRPLLLCIQNPTDEARFVIDLRSGPDIICPDDVVQPALDTEWLALSHQLHYPKQTCDFSQANQYLRQFLQILLSGSGTKKQTSP